MPKRSKVAYVNLRTRVPKEIGDAILARSSEKYPGYRVVRDIVVAAVTGVNVSTMSMATVGELARVAKVVGYNSVDALILDLSKAFLRVWRYNNNQLTEEESVPDEYIRDMFDDLSNNVQPYDKGISIRKGT